MEERQATATKRRLNACVGPYIAAGVLQVVRTQELLHRLSQVVLQDSSDQLVVLFVQRAVHRRQAAMDGRVGHGVAQLPDNNRPKLPVVLGCKVVTIFRLNSNIKNFF